MIDVWNAFLDLLAGIVGHSIAKLFLFGILVIPAAALLGFAGLLPRRRK